MKSVGKFLFSLAMSFATLSCSVRISNELGDRVYDPVEGSYVLVRNYSTKNIDFLFADCTFYLENGKVLSKRVRIENLAPNKEIKIRSGLGKDRKVECKPLPWYMQDSVRISR